MKPAPLLCLIALCVAAAACDSKQAKPGEADAAGEVLPGSASDAMLPYDTIRSQPPLAPQTEAARPGVTAGRGDASEAAEEADPAASDVPAPTITLPKPEASGGTN